MEGWFLWAEANTLHLCIQESGPPGACPELPPYPQ